MLDAAAIARRAAALWGDDFGPRRIERVGNATLMLGDCRDVLPLVSAAHACVTDPPYELGFMGKKWDASGIANDPGMWRALLNALRPGAHVLAFSGSRTYHRMTCAIEDAGFDIRDQIMWLYGSGFPKSHDISKAIDKEAGAEREVVGHDAKKAAQQTAKKDSAAYGNFEGNSGAVTAPATDAAKQWDGWGTALKPAHEPVCVGRKPLIGTVAANVLEHAAGGLNIDACRVGNDEIKTCAKKGMYGAGSADKMREQGFRPYHIDNREIEASTHVGRFPANVMHDGSEEVTDRFPIQKSGGAPASRNADKFRNTFGAFKGGEVENGIGRSEGSAARFFYCAKASKKDRGKGNTHPTVKPTELMRYLCRLVTPPGGMIVDPFMGSGSTGVAAIAEGFAFTGIEQDEKYFEIALRRIRAAVDAA